MAYKIKHRVMAQQLPFPTRTAAQRYADRYGGGLKNWIIVVAATPPAVSEPQPDRGSPP